MADFSPELFPKISTAVNLAHETLSKERGASLDDVRVAPVCREVSTMITLSLFDQGETSLSAESRGGVINPLTGNEIDEHRYAVIGDRADGIIVDAAWQQFLPADKRDSGLTPALVGNREEVIEQAIAAGVSVENAHLLYSAEGGQPAFKTPQERIEASF